MADILNGIRVIDLGRFISAPYCTMLLADMGAEVIKVERPGTGEDGRRLGPYKNGVSVYVSTFNRNKKGITVNTRTKEGREILCDLIRNADVLVENYRPGTMAKMNLDYETVSKLNPRIIMASISGFGQKGRYQDKAAFDGIASAMSGLYMVNCTKEGPKTTGLAIGDHLTGVYHALAIMMALFDRERTGRGQYIDTAMLDCLFSMFETRLPNYVLNGVNIGTVPPFGYGDPLACPSNLYHCCDGYVNLHAGTDVNFKKFAKITGNPALNDKKYETIENRMAEYTTVDNLVAQWFQDKTVEEVDEIMRKEGIPCGIVYDMEKIYHDPYFRERGSITDVEVPGLGSVPFIGSPLHLKTQPILQQERAPLIGEHNEEIYKKLLHYTDEKIRSLKEAGAI